MVSGQVAGTFTPPFSDKAIPFNQLYSNTLSFPVAHITSAKLPCKKGCFIPASPGFFGIIQACFRESLALFGIDETLAVAASMYYHLTNYISVTAVGFYYLSRLGLTLSEVEKEAEETDIEELETSIS